MISFSSAFSTISPRPSVSPQRSFQSGTPLKPSDHHSHSLSHSHSNLGSSSYSDYSRPMNSPGQIGASPSHEKKGERKKSARKLLGFLSSPGQGDKYHGGQGDPTRIGLSNRAQPRLLLLFIVAFSFLLIGLSLSWAIQHSPASLIYRTLQPPCPLPSELDAAKEEAAAEAPPPAMADVAVVLIGQLRQFELTGPSIAKWLLSPPPLGQPWYQGTQEGTPQNPPLIDLFVVAPFDDCSFKILSLLPTDDLDSPSPSSSSSVSPLSLGPQLVGTHPAPALGHVSVSFYKEMNINSSAYPWKILYVLDRGPQGLLRQFKMDWAALERIREHERNGRRGRPYKWIMKTRPDSYWLGTPPPVINLGEQQQQEGTEPQKKHSMEWVYAPNGADYGGYNDRLALGESAAMSPVFQRLINLQEVTSRWHSGELNSTASLSACLTSKIRPGKLNAECVLRVLLDHMWAKNLTVGRAVFPFCLLSHHSWIKMYSNAYTHPSWGGYYCRPCHMSQDKNEPGMCQNHGEWEDDWAVSFEAAAGPALASRAKALMSLSYSQCVLMLEKAKRRVLYGAVPQAKEDPLEQHPAWLGVAGGTTPLLASGAAGAAGGEGGGGQRERPLGEWWASTPQAICGRRQLGSVRPLRRKNITSYAWPLAIRHLRTRCQASDGIGCVMYLLADRPTRIWHSVGEAAFSWELLLLNLTQSLSISLGPDAPVPGFTSVSDSSTLGPTKHSKPMISKRRRSLLWRGSTHEAAGGAAEGEGTSTSAGGRSLLWGRSTQEPAGASADGEGTPGGGGGDGDGEGGVSSPKVSLVILSSQAESSLQKTLFLDVQIIQKADAFTRSAKDLLGSVTVAAPLDPSVSNLNKVMALHHHSRLDLLKVDAPLVDSAIKDWVSQGAAPVTCQLLLDIGSRAQGEEEALGPTQALSWGTIVEALSSLGFELDQCNGADMEKQGQCFWFKPSVCF